MESTTRSLWVFILVALVAMCLCAAAITALAAGVFTFAPLQRSVSGSQEERLEQSFQLGSSPTLEIDNFAGTVRVQAGDGDTIRMVAVKKAPRQATVSEIDVKTTEGEGSLTIKTSKSFGFGNASVDLELTVPAGTQLRVHTGAGTIQVTGLAGSISLDSGAGTIDVRDVTGDLEATTGAGTIDVERVVGRARLHTGAGTISYQGTPQGDCRFESGVGRVELRLPPDLSAKLDVGTGVGSVDVRYDVDGQVSPRSVQGTVGGGEGATIYAHSGTGNVELRPR